MEFDLIVIGAGPAGAAAAMTAVRAGLRCALVDKARFPRDKLCGAGFTGRAAKYYREIFATDLPPEFDQKTTVELYGFGEKLGVIADVPTVYLTMRLSLDAHLCALALAAGAEDFTGQRIAELSPEAGKVTLSDGRILTAPIVIGADGVNSVTARTLFGRAFDPARIGFALEVEAPPISPTRRCASTWGRRIGAMAGPFPNPAATPLALAGCIAEIPISNP
ncbi:FAD-binding protein [Phaeobacter sp. J2-8]|uniref:FAD-binding protein n=1 Tax=Phaeobacter sp. J2-8 TaxID=2931394 RepID=UPI001FD1376B|nr:FAD-binding protein [Phaeobacter sp. J2-8]MCJ7873075.1 FAD-binding protein [Phaeobacter sp. J2-8]